MNKRILSFFLITILCFSCIILPSCGEKKEVAKPGKINAVKTQTDTEVKESKDKHNIFTKIEDPFGFSYKQVSIPRAQMRMEIPEKWTLETLSHREYRILPDKESQIFRDTGISIIFNYEEGFWNRPGSGLNERCDVFKYELPGIKYKTVGGGTYSITANYDLRDMEINASWCKKDDRVLFGNNSDSLIKGITSGTKSDKSFATYYFVHWTDDVFACFSAITPYDEDERTKDLLEYIISSITYMPLKVDSFMDVDLTHFTFSAPSNMKPDDYDRSIIRDDFKNKTATAGMAVMHKKIKEKIDEKALNGKTGEYLAAALLAAENSYSIYTDVKDTSTVYIDGRRASKFKTYVCLDIFNSGVTTNSVHILPIPSNFYMDVYYVEDTGNLIALAYHTSQQNLANAINKSIKNGRFS